MKTPITKLKDTILEMIKNGGTEEDLFAVIAHIDNWGLTEEKEQIIEAMGRTAMYVSVASIDKEIGKMTIEDLYNQIYNK